jgi:hypothetical protein
VWRGQSYASSQWLCLQSVSPASLQEFTIGRLAFCFLPLAAILESPLCYTFLAACSPHASHCDVLSNHTSKSNWANWPQLKSSETRSEDKPFLFISWLSQVFYTIIDVLES